MINLIDIYTRVNMYVNASPMEINFLVSECLSRLSFFRTDNAEELDISSTITSTTQSISIPTDVLSIRRILINDEEVTERYDAPYLEGNYYYINNEERTINFNFDVTASDTVVLIVNEFYAPDYTAYNNTTTFSVPSHYVDVIKEYVLMKLFIMDKYYNIDKYMLYKSLYEDSFKILKRKMKAGKSYMNFGVGL